MGSRSIIRGTRQRNTSIDLKENDNYPKSASETAALENLKKEGIALQTIKSTQTILVRVD